MSPATIFDIQLVLGYVPWLICFGVYFWPRLKSMDRVEAQRAIAILHAFRFFGLVFILPGVVGPDLPAGFAEFAAYGDFATGLLAILALLTIRARFFFWPLVLAYNIVGIVDLFVDYYHGTVFNLAALSTWRIFPLYSRSKMSDEGDECIEFFAACAMPALQSAWRSGFWRYHRSDCAAELSSTRTFDCGPPRTSASECVSECGSAPA
ncbi:hypothetical protein [Mesorhizobium sp. M1027]|uniref:hypothetical protein n=1 Tax=Mesorhizobium sp. M1027 TaxID=2957050 RepID=UPI00333A7912